MGFADRLKDAMERRGYRKGGGGINRFAEEVPVQPSSVSRWRRGKVPDAPTTARIASLLGVSPEWLRKGEQGEGPMVEGEVSQREGRVENGLLAVREPLAEVYAALSTGSLIPPIQIPSDPAQRMASDHIWSKYSARIAQMRHEGAPLDYTEVQDWLDAAWRAAKEDRENAEAAVRLSLQKPQNGKQG